jgi:hypothetical protein
MRASLVLRTIAAVLTVACDSGFSPTAALAGTWVSPSSIPGSYTTMTLAASDATVTGNGTKFIEAGAPAPFTVSGSRQGLSIKIALVFASSDTAFYAGHLVTAAHLTGTLTRTGQAPFSQDFFKQ